MQTISKNCHVHRMNASNPPCLEVASPCRLVVETWDALEGRSREFFEQCTPQSDKLPHANPATGPIRIDGAMPRDVLEVIVHDIRVTGAGYITVKTSDISHSHHPENVYRPIPVQGTHLLFNNRTLPLEPMIGVIGTAPQPGMDPWCQEAGDHGANMDAKIIKKGAKVLLPVFVEGALLALGDIHAAMGDGEVFGAGIEIGAEVEITVNVRKDITIRRPVIIVDDYVSCVSSHQDILVAKDLVVRDMGELLTTVCGISDEDAFALIAFYGDLQFCQVVNPQKTVRLSIQNRYIRLVCHDSHVSRL